MCGISGFLDLNQRQGNQSLQATALAMVNSLRHRGPDDVGVWADAECGIALGHRRLAILDLSPAGHQPMRSACGRYVISFNGEIYNFRALRSELEEMGLTFKGHSDTEVMLGCISQWGLDAAVARFNGMFAFALWDRAERNLYLVRDRLGEKPLYYGWQGRVFLFGSELKAIRCHPGFVQQIDRDALVLFLRHNRVPAPYSIYKGIAKVLPGTIIRISHGDPGSAPRIKAYWSLQTVAESARANPGPISHADAISQLNDLLMDSVKIRMESDVPLGAYLSGGIDSSTIAAFMQVQSSRPVRTFTVGFREAAFNEAHYAKAVAQHLGTAHTELLVTPEETMGVIPRLPSLYDEPFADSSQIPTFLISALARQDVTVILSGDGGDELFGGYQHYFQGQAVWKWSEAVPTSMKATLAKLIRRVPVQSWNTLGRMMSSLLPKAMERRSVGEKLYKMAGALEGGVPEAVYRMLATHWNDATSVVIGAEEPVTVLTDATKWLDLPTVLQRLMYLDQLSYLPDDILVKVDRASMGVSLEARVPFLDHRIVEYSWRVPTSLNVRNGVGKRLLRDLLYRHVPPVLIDRPKMGFGVPIDAWLRGPLREWAEALLDEKRMREQGFLSPGPIHAKWKEHLSGRYNWQFHLWDVLMFQAWLQHENEKTISPESMPGWRGVSTRGRVVMTH